MRERLRLLLDVAVQFPSRAHLQYEIDVVGVLAECVEFKDRRVLEPAS